MSVKLSIIIPVYNTANFIEKCVKSILNQIFNDFELILVNDGSPDNSGEICDRLASEDKRIKVLHQENKGVSTARNAGLDEARGQYIIFIDSDDWISPEFIETYFNEIHYHPSQLIYQGLVNEFKDRKSYLSLPLKRCKGPEIIEALIQVEYQECLGGACNKLFRREIIEKNKIRFNPNISYGEDKLFTLEYCLNIDSITLLDTCYYHYNRMGEGSLSNTHHSSDKLKILIKLEYELFGKILKKYPDNQLLAAVNGRYLSMSKYALISMYRPGEKYDKMQRKKLINSISKFTKDNLIDKRFDRDVPTIGSFLISLKRDWILKLMMKTRYQFSKIYLRFRAVRTK